MRLYQVQVWIEGLPPAVRPFIRYPFTLLFRLACIPVVFVVFIRLAALEGIFFTLNLFFTTSWTLFCQMCLPSSFYRARNKLPSANSSKSFTIQSRLHNAVDNLLEAKQRLKARDRDSRQQAGKTAAVMQEKQEVLAADKRSPFLASLHNLSNLHHDVLKLRAGEVRVAEGRQRESSEYSTAFVFFLVFVVAPNTLAKTTTETSASFPESPFSALGDAGPSLGRYPSEEEILTEETFAQYLSALEQHYSLELFLPTLFLLSTYLDMVQAERAYHEAEEAVQSAVLEAVIIRSEAKRLFQLARREKAGKETSSQVS